MTSWLGVLLSLTFPITQINSEDKPVRWNFKKKKKKRLDSCKKKRTLKFPVIIKDFKIKHEVGKSRIRDWAMTGLMR